MSEDAAPPLAGGRYRLVAVLGVGGMASVYRVYDALLDVFRAVKVLDPDLTRRRKTRERFLNEARTMARLRHPNIVSVFDMGIDGNRVFMLMELVEGGSLMDRIERHGPLAPRLAVRVMMDVMRALELSHRHGVVHRDVKPHNVLLTLEGVPKVTDFGIAAVNSGDDNQLTRTGAVMGTWAYMAPEQRKNAKSVDARSDVYAAGATLFATVTGEEPLDLYVEETHAEMLEGLPEPLADLIRTAARYRPELRYQSAAEMAEALEECLNALPPDPAGSIPVIPSSSDADYQRPDTSDFDHSLVSDHDGAPPRRGAPAGADLPTMDDPTDDVPFDPRGGFDLDDLEKLPAVRQSLPSAVLKAPADQRMPATPREFDLPPPPDELVGRPSAPRPAADAAVDVPAAPPPKAPRPAKTEDREAAGLRSVVSAALHSVRILPGGIRIAPHPLARAILASPRVSHVLLASSGERFRCNVEVPAGKKAPPGTTALRSEASTALIEGINRRRGTWPEAARWAAVSAAFLLASGGLFGVFWTQVPADLAAALSGPMAVLLAGTWGGGALAAAVVPLALWSWWLGRSSLIVYDLDEDRLRHWAQLVELFEVLAAARVSWVVGGGAAKKTSRTKALKLSRGEPAGVHTNAGPWQTTIDGARLTFLPDGIWVEARRRPVAVVRWRDVQVTGTRLPPSGASSMDLSDGEDGAPAVGELALTGPGLDVVLRSHQAEVLARLRDAVDALSAREVSTGGGGGVGFRGGLGAFL